MSILQIKKPNDELAKVIRERKLTLHSVSATDNKLKIVYRNVEDKKTLRLSIETKIPSHLLDEEIYSSFRLKTFEVVRISKYMGYSTMVCRKITFEDADGDEFSLEV